MEQHRILPFYMSYPFPVVYQDENAVMRDLEYIQQMYPLKAKRYQKVIAEALNQLDYEGSMIYDEYPDKWQLIRLAESMKKILENQENEEADKNPDMEMIQLLLFYEIYRRRHNSRKGFLKF